MRNTLNKARTLCDKWRSSGGRGGQAATLDAAIVPGDPALQGKEVQGRLSRWFSIRRGSTHQYDVEGSDPTASPSRNKGMPLLPEVSGPAKYLVIVIIIRFVRFVVSPE